MAAHAALMKELTQALRGRVGIVAAYLYGSAARGEPNPHDADIAVMFRPDLDGFEEALRLHVELEGKTELPPDVHDLDGLPLEVQMRVLREGQLVVDHEPSERVQREIGIRFAYEDFRPYLERMRAGAVRRLAA